MFTNKRQGTGKDRGARRAGFLAGLLVVVGTAGLLVSAASSALPPTQGEVLPAVALGAPFLLLSSNLLP